MEQPINLSAFIRVHLWTCIAPDQNANRCSSSQMNEVQILTRLRTLKSPITSPQPPILFSSSCISPNRELL